MRILATIGWALATILALIMLSQKHCNQSVSHNDTTTVTVTLYDTVKHTVSIPAGKPIAEHLRLPVGKHRNDPSSSDADQHEGHSGNSKGDSGISQPLTLDYYMVRYYQDSFSDSNLVGILKDSVYMNKLIWHGFDYRLLRPISVTNTTIIKQVEDRNRWYAGFGMSVGSNSVGAGPEILYCRQKIAYRAGYQFGSMHPVQFSALIKIGK